MFFRKPEAPRGALEDNSDTKVTVSSPTADSHSPASAAADHYPLPSPSPDDGGLSTLIPTYPHHTAPSGEHMASFTKRVRLGNGIAKTSFLFLLMLCVPTHSEYLLYYCSVFPTLGIQISPS